MKKKDAIPLINFVMCFIFAVTDLVTNVKYLHIDSTHTLATAYYVLVVLFILAIIASFFLSCCDPDGRCTIPDAIFISIAILLSFIICGFTIALDRIAYW